MLRIGSATSKILPAAEPPSTAFVGNAKFCRLKMLKFSQRNCRFIRSLSLKFLKNDQFAIKAPGPRSELREASPKRYAPGTAYAAGLNHPFGLGLETPGLPTISG